MFLEFERGDEKALPHRGDVVFVGVADFPNESVQPQSFQDATDLSAIFPVSTRWSKRLLQSLM